jgi:hypothetical protein
MKAFTAAALALVAPATALLRFPCAQLVIDRLDPLVTPGQAPSPHLHQILGGNSFNVTMDPSKHMPGESTCTSCQFSEDFSVSTDTCIPTSQRLANRSIELLDSSAVFQSKKRNIQTRSSDSELGLQRRQRRHDCILHARRSLQLPANIQGPGFPTRLPHVHRRRQRPHQG